MTEQLSSVIAVVNSKGGVGKTTVAVNLGAALAAPARRVLLVDLDSQASASNWCGMRRGRHKPSVASVLLHDFPIEQAIRATSTPHLDILTGSIELASADLALGGVRGRETTLKQALKGLRSSYPVVVLDCPPGLSLVSVNALVAADAVLIPVPPQPLALDALATVVAAIDSAKRRLDTRFSVPGVLVTMTEGDDARRAAVRSRLPATYRDRMFHTEICASGALQDAAGSAQTIFSHAPRSRAADQFRRLAAEVLERFPAHSRRPNASLRSRVAIL